jgi:hypothetical protein
VVGHSRHRDLLPSRERDVEVRRHRASS